MTNCKYCKNLEDLLKELNPLLTILWDRDDPQPTRGVIDNTRKVLTESLEYVDGIYPMGTLVAQDGNIRIEWMSNEHDKEVRLVVRQYLRDSYVYKESGSLYTSFECSGKILGETLNWFMK